MADNLPDVYARFEEVVDEDRDKVHKDLVGESMDEDHPGSEGWIQIKSFNFDFGLERKDGATAGKGGAFHALVQKLMKQGYTQEQANGMASGAAHGTAGKPEKKTEKSWGKSGALHFDAFNFTKSSDAMSKRLIEMCHSGKRIPRVLVVMCRPGGVDKDRGKKIEFVTLTFKDVYLKSCVLKLVNEELPTEDVHFEYNFVKLESTWTGNAVGDRRPEQPISAEWDLVKGAEEAEEESED